MNKKKIKDLVQITKEEQFIKVRMDLDATQASGFLMYADSIGLTENCAVSLSKIKSVTDKFQVCLSGIPEELIRGLLLMMQRILTLERGYGWASSLRRKTVRKEE